MDKNKVFTVKIYFIQPVEALSVLVDTLIRLEFETYIVREADKEKLLKILGQDIRNVIFLSIINEIEFLEYSKYLDHLVSVNGTLIQTGAFVNANLKSESRNTLLERQCAVIDFNAIKTSPLEVMKRILDSFEAKGKRKYIRTKPVGVAEAYITYRNLSNPIKAPILEISSQALICRLPQGFSMYIEAGDYLHDVLLVLKGIRVRTSVQVVGFDENQPQVHVLTFCTAKIVDNKFTYNTAIRPEMKQKLHAYIKLCLKENLARKLAEIEE